MNSTGEAIRIPNQRAKTFTNLLFTTITIAADAIRYHVRRVISKCDITLSFDEEPLQSRNARHPVYASAEGIQGDVFAPGS
jgi:hypothetical protein